VLQRAATRCNTLQRAATRCNTLQRAATRCNMLQRAGTRCNTLHCDAAHAPLGESPFFRAAADLKHSNRPGYKTKKLAEILIFHRSKLYSLFLVETFL